MFNTLYFIWLLLPLCLFGLAGWGMIKPMFKVPGKEHTKQYFSQALFCSLLLVVAIFINESEWYESVIESVSFGALDFRVASWLLYPAVLLLAASMQQWWKKRKELRVKPNRAGFRPPSEF